MSFAEIKKSINSDLSKPLDTLIGEIRDDILQESCTVTVSTSDSASVDGQTITITNTLDSSRSETYTLATGESSHAFRIIPNHTYHITVSSKSGYSTPAQSSTFTAVAGNVRTVAMVYGVELCTVNVSTSDSAAVDGQIITMTNLTVGANTQTYTLASGENSHVFKVMSGCSYHITVSSKSGYVTPAQSSTFTAVSGGTRSVTMTYVVIVRYGIRITKAESNPATRVTYLYDAVGKTPAAMNMSTNVMDYGGWADAFFVAQNRPVMLKYDGTVDYELSHTDQTKKLDGVTASDVSNAAYAGNAMSEFPLIWLYEYEDATYEYHIISNAQYNANYKAYAHMKDSTTVKDKTYLPMFGGYDDGTRLRSLADKAIMVSQTRNTEVSRATANGTGWDTITYSQWNLVNVLLALISQSTNGQVKFGTGRCKSTNTAAINTGSLKATGQFKGYNDETSDVKVFYLEGWWGNVWAGMRGMVTNASGRTLVKRTPPYNFDGSGYADTGVTPGGTNGGFINTMKTDNDLGNIAKTASGSETTYYCDGLWFAASCYALVGGNWSYAGRVGPACVNLSNAASDAGTSLGSRLSYTPQ